MQLLVLLTLFMIALPQQVHGLTQLSNITRVKTLKYARLGKAKETVQVKWKDHCSKYRKANEQLKESTETRGFIINELLQSCGENRKNTFMPAVESLQNIVFHSRIIRNSNEVVSDERNTEIPTEQEGPAHWGWTFLRIICPPCEVAGQIFNKDSAYNNV